MTIQSDISVGEFLDKLTILEIKHERMTDPAKRANVDRELNLLQRLWRESPYAENDISDAYRRLKGVNESLWDIEDQIRAKEAQGVFDDEFIQLARSVYLTNDQRAAIKKELNLRLGSDLVEEKSYTDYRREESAQTPE